MCGGMMRINGNLLFASDYASGTELTNGGWLAPDGVLLEYFRSWDEDPYNIVWREEIQSYAYFCFDLASWEAISTQQAHHQKVVMHQFLDWLGSFLRVNVDNHRVMLVEQTLWYLGVVNSQGERCHLYFTRDAEKSDPAALRQQLAYDSGHMPALVLSDSEDALSLLGELPKGILAMPLEKLLRRNTNACLLDESVLTNLACQATVDYHHARYVAPVRFSTDYRQVKWHGQWYSVTKKQAAILEALVKENGRAHKNLLCVEADTNQAVFHV